MVHKVFFHLLGNKNALPILSDNYCMILFRSSSKTYLNIMSLMGGGTRLTVYEKPPVSCGARFFWIKCYILQLVLGLENK